MNIGSTSGRIPGTFGGAYSGTKFALDAMHDVLRAEVASSGVFVSLIVPGAVATPFWRQASASLDQARERLSRNGVDATLAMIREEWYADFRERGGYVRLDLTIDLCAPGGQPGVVAIAGVLGVEPTAAANDAEPVRMHAVIHEEGCVGCSFGADQLDGSLIHLVNHDVMLVAVSRAPYAKIAPFHKRMGWRFKWLSSAGSDFNFDYNVSFDEADRARVLWQRAAAAQAAAPARSA